MLLHGAASDTPRAAAPGARAAAAYASAPHTAASNALLLAAGLPTLALATGGLVWKLKRPKAHK